MNVLGISGHTNDAAAAIAVDGRVVAAVTEESLARVPGIGYAQTGGSPHAAVAACLSIAGLAHADLDDVARVSEENSASGTLSAVEADARHAAMAVPGDGPVVVAGSESSGIAVFRRRDGRLQPDPETAPNGGAAHLAASGRVLARLLGLADADPFAGLDRLAAGEDAAFMADLAALRPGDDEALGALVARLAGEHADRLADSQSQNARVQDMRRQLAASFTGLAAGVVARVATKAGDASNGAPIVAGGALFGNARFNTELSRLMLSGGGLHVAAVPERVGRAVGAAGGQSLDTLALGPAFSDEEIKRTLDNCRLDYVYEPDWARLIARASRLLAQGKVVAWFQGPMAFGPRAQGTRSILVDPSNRYARQNVNEYLHARPLDDPLPLALSSSMAAACLVGGAAASGERDVDVRAEWRVALAAALDARHRVRVHTAASSFEPRLRDLLDRHHEATGTPGLIELNLAGRDEPTACTPRDAVRTMYASAIDALVIGRFLLMKDYWLLRAGETGS
jgi:carbamoyltransferase